MFNENYIKALNNINLLVDSTTFIPLNSLQDESNVIIGYGEINGRLVFVYSQYGFINENHVKAVDNVYKKAVTMGAPVIAILNSSGVAIDEGFSVFEQFGNIFQTMSSAKGIIPQYCVVLNDTFGVSSLISGMSDFTFITEKSTLSFDNATFKSENNFVLRYADEQTCFSALHDFVSIMPSNHLEDAYNQSFSMSNFDTNVPELLNKIGDSQGFVKTGSTENNFIVTGFLHIADQNCGIIMLNDEFNLSSSCLIKKMINFCNSFSLPIITINNLVKINGTDYNNTICELSEIVHAFSTATVPKINVITKTNSGSGLLIFNSKFIGADLSIALNTAKLTIIDKDNAKKVLDLEVSDDINKALAAGVIDVVVSEDELQSRLNSSILMLSTKKINSKY